MTESLLDLNQYAYEKCAHCHLFVDENPACEGWDSTVPWLHMARGDDDDNAIEDSHNAAPSGEKHTLAWWKANGPLAMRARFEVELYEDFLTVQSLGAYDEYPATALVEFVTEHCPEDGVTGIVHRLGEFNDWLLDWERQGHGKIIMSARLDRLMPTV